MVLNPIIAQTLGYMGVVLLAFLVINFLMAGFLRTFMSVKGSRGKKIMTNIYALNRNYGQPGIVDNGFYVYKDGNGHEKRLKIPKDNVFYRFLNITWVNVDEEKNVFISPDGHEINGFDAEKYNNLYLRTLYRPSILDPKMQVMFISAIVTPILVLIVLGLLGFVINKKIDAMGSDVSQLKSYFVSLNSTVI
jgi:hypothetical protein